MEDTIFRLVVLIHSKENKIYSSNFELIIQVVTARTVFFVGGLHKKSFLMVLRANIFQSP